MEMNQNSAEIVKSFKHAGIGDTIYWLALMLQKEKGAMNDCFVTFIF